jgi:hypothetical protein
VSHATPPLTPEQLERISMASAYGIPWEGIGHLLGIPWETLRKQDGAPEAYHRGLHEANEKIAGTLFKKAINGDTTSCIFWLKTRARWREKDREDVDRVEVTGKDGAPLYATAHDKVVAFARGIVERNRLAEAAAEPDPN